MDHLENRLAADLWAKDHLWHCTAAGAAAGGETDFRFHRNAAAAAYVGYGKLTMPWSPAWLQWEGLSLAEAWQRMKEEEKDPTYAAFLRGKRRELREGIAQQDAELKAAEAAAKTYQAREAEQARVGAARAARARQHAERRTKAR